jgi:chemotaxis signal transduction protein
MEETKTSRAWLLDFGRNLQAACGHHEMWQVLISPTLFSVPYTPFYCDSVLIFQDNILPVLDIVSLFEGQKIVQENRVIGIAIYQENPNEPIHYAGVQLADMPRSIFVTDDQFCELSADQPFQEPLAISCFSHENQAIPILDFAYLFLEEFNTLQHQRI